MKRYFWSQWLIDVYIHIRSCREVTCKDMLFQILPTTGISSPGQSHRMVQWNVGPCECSVRAIGIQLVLKNGERRQVHPNVIWHLLFGWNLKFGSFGRDKSENYASQWIEMLRSFSQSTDLNSYRPISHTVCAFLHVLSKDLSLCLFYVWGECRRKWLFIKLFRKSVGRIGKKLPI